jgi:hypothetical protein
MQSTKELSEYGKSWNLLVNKTTKAKVRTLPLWVLCVNWGRRFKFQAKRVKIDNALTLSPSFYLTWSLKNSVNAAQIEPSQSFTSLLQRERPSPFSSHRLLVLDGRIWWGEKYHPSCWFIENISGTHWSQSSKLTGSRMHTKKTITVYTKYFLVHKFQ